ncbi:hypothetical protein Pfo_020583 [Paulownia fortunei]|nr:hypothetical protein Pfo_020583 [Paulownia fortunei]
MDFARGKIVMALEGGYNPVSLANSAQACIEVLLQDKPLIRSMEDLPLESTWLLIQAVCQALCVHWPVLAAKLTDKVINSTSSQIEVAIGVTHVIQEEVDCHTTSLQANLEVEQVHTAANYFCLEGRKVDLESVRARKNVMQEQAGAVSLTRPLSGRNTGGGCSGSFPPCPIVEPRFSSHPPNRRSGGHGEVSPPVVPHKRARGGPSDTSPCHGVGKGFFYYGVNPLEEIESFWTSLLGNKSRNMVSEDDIKRLMERPVEETEAKANSGAY